MNFEKLNKEIYSNKLFEIISELALEMKIEAYAVGGYLRDLLLDKNPSEVDFLIIGDGPEFASKLAKKLNINNITVFKNFGTAHFNYNEMTLEFVGARKESYSKESRNPFIKQGTFDDDISRRDFTINAVAVSLNKENFGELIDKFNGIEDLKNGIIITPLDPMVTFNDDPLRILRAIRFASKLEFKISENVFDAAIKLCDRLNIIAQERITDEFLKILATKKPSVGLIYLHKAGILKVIFPELENLAGVEQRKDFHHKDVFYHTCQVVDKIATYTDNVYLRFAALVHDIGKPVTKKFIENIGWTFHGHEELGARMLKDIFKRFKLPYSNLQYVETLTRLHMRPIALVDETVTDSAIRRLIVSAGDFLDDLITLCRADITSKNNEKVQKYLENYEIVVNKINEVNEKDALRLFQSPVKGEEIMNILKIPPSKLVGEIKTAIEEAILDGKIDNTHDAALNYLYEIKDSFIKS